MSDFKPGSLSEQLETLLDKHGLLAIATALEGLCSDKAEHLRVNWQDRSSAKVWDRAAKHLDTLTNHVAKLDLPGE
jgi:hypothetical protein